MRLRLFTRLRALTDGNSASAPPVVSTGPPKYKLAQHRYGREEMLGLFVPNTPVPDGLHDLNVICVEKAQHPLAFAPPSEDEQVTSFVNCYMWLFLESNVITK